MTFPLTGPQHLLIPSSLFYLPLCTQDHAFASNLLKITYVSFIRKYQRYNGGGIFQTSIKVTFLANTYLFPYTSPEQWWLWESSSFWSCLSTAELYCFGLSRIVLFPFEHSKIKSNPRKHATSAFFYLDDFPAAIQAPGFFKLLNILSASCSVWNRQSARSRAH